MSKILKKTSSCALFAWFILLSSSAHSQKMEQVLPRIDDTAQYYYRDLDCSDDHNCTIAVIRKLVHPTNFTQFVERTTDGGASWILQELPPRDINVGYQTALRGAVAIDSLNVYVFGDSCYIARTTDAGATWKNVSFPSYQSLLAGSFVDAKVGTFVGSNGTVLITNDGGDTWQLIDSLPAKLLVAVRMWDVDHIATFSSGNGQLLWTEDGFATYDTAGNVIKEPHVGDTIRWAGPPLWYGLDTLIVPVNSQTLTSPYKYMATIYRTINRGRDWTEIEVDHSHLAEITTGAGLSSGGGIFLGKEYGFFRTSDFGRSWSQGSLDEGQYIPKVEHVRMLKKNEAIITSPQGDIGRVFLVHLDPLSVDGLGSKMRLGTRVYPNPSAGEISIQKWYTYDEDVNIINVLGEVALRTKINREPGTSTIDCSQLPNGTYTILIKHDGADLPVGRFVLMK